MFIVLLTYIQPKEAIDLHIQQHREFIGRNLEAGHFVASGPQVPRTGGVILARTASREQLDVLLGEDPFLREGVAEHSVIEFDATKFAPGAASVFGAPS